MAITVHPRRFINNGAIFILSIFSILPCALTAPSTTTQNYFWHVTDFHMDINYTTSGNVYQMCWQGDDTDVSASPMGSFGDYHCDSPYKLVQSAVKAMKTWGPEPDFILWTGDDKAHVSDANFDPDIVYDIVQNLTLTLNKTFPKTQFVPVLGNHDWYPTHKLPAGPATLYERIGTLWKPWIKEGYETFKKGGFYTIKLDSGIRFVVLNTALYYEKNDVTLTATNDPGDQFQWFDKVMTEAKSQNEKVYVTSHVPPGVFERHIIKDGWRWLKPEANQKLVKLVVKHSDSIIGLFFAHHHTDSFRVLYDAEGKPVSWMLIAPAVTPWNTTLSSVGPNNPGLRKMVYDGQTQQVSRPAHLRARDPGIRLLRYNPHSGQVKTFEQYYLNLSVANQNNEDQWQLEYDAQKAYQLGDSGVTPETLNRLVQTFNSSDRTLFDLYYLYNSVSYQSPKECDAECQQYQYCVITNVDYSAFSACQKNSNMADQIENNKIINDNNNGVRGCNHRRQTFRSHPSSRTRYQWHPHVSW